MNPMTSESVVFMTILTPSQSKNKHQVLERISLLLHRKPQASSGYINELFLQCTEYCFTLLAKYNVGTAPDRAFRTPDQAKLSNVFFFTVSCGPLVCDTVHASGHLSSEINAIYVV
jgi:hypothetical protein